MKTSLYYSIYLKLYNKKNNNITEYYQHHLNRVVSNFALTSNIALLMGGKIKTNEYISGRYADILSNIYMGYACLWYYEKNKHISNIDKLLESSMNYHFNNIQNSTYAISNNFPIPIMGSFIKIFTYLPWI